MSSYKPNTWAKGDVVTSAKLNNIENGIVNAGQATPVLMVLENPEDESSTMILNKTWQELFDAAGEGAFLFAMGAGPQSFVYGFISGIANTGNEYLVGIDMAEGASIRHMNFVADKPDARPSYDSAPPS